MSGSATVATVFVTDTPKMIKEKVNKRAFSGGKESIEEHRKHGADLSVDVPYEYLRYLMEDDARLRQIGDDYGSGKLLTGEVKAILISELTEVTRAHQEARAKVTDDTVRHFMDPSRESLRYF